jgi:acylglycerol lipase
LKTGHELLRTSLDLEQRLQEVSLPFIVLHGEADRVTDKSVSEQLLRVASSSDKTIKLYPEMWHGLLYGEPVENSDNVFEDIIDWLDNRTHRGNTRLEREQKHKHDDFSKSK